MKVALLEIWDFITVIDAEKINRIDLVLGNHQVEDVSATIINEIKEGQDYDTELLPDLFTNTEITWQPNEVRVT